MKDTTKIDLFNVNGQSVYGTDFARKDEKASLNARVWGNVSVPDTSFSLNGIALHVKPLAKGNGYHLSGKAVVNGQYCQIGVFAIIIGAKNGNPQPGRYTLNGNVTVIGSKAK